MRRPAAVLWDMDGTLVDTEPYWIETEFALAEQYGGTWSDAHALNLVGNDLLESGRYIREHMGIDLRRSRSSRSCSTASSPGSSSRCPGARVRSSCWPRWRRRVPCALVTMSYERFVAPILAQLPAETFRVIVTGDTVEFGKPHPEPYLTAAAAWASTRRTAWPSRTPTPAPSRPRRRLPGAGRGEPRARAGR